MSSSGLIFVAIAIMWAAVLVPMWLRSHDNASENRSADRFGQAMRVLSRRTEEDHDADPELATDRSTSAEEREAHPEPAEPAEPIHERPRRERARPTQEKKTRPSLARRRARTLGVLAALTVLLTLGALVSPLPLWAPLPFVVLLVAFVAHLRSQAKRSAAVRARRRASQLAPDVVASPEADEHQEAVLAPRSRRSMVEFVAGPSKAMVVETKATASAFADDDQAWRPNPLPVPTYVTAPKAIRPIKVIDLTTPGAFSSGRLIDDENLADEDLLAADLAADELDALLEHEATGPVPKTDAERDSARRAVGD